jgi:hypothetical protein
MPNGQVARVELTKDFCSEIPKHISLTVDDIKAEGSTKLNDYDELVIHKPSNPSRMALFVEDSLQSQSQLSGISSTPIQTPSTPSIPVDPSMKPVTRSTTLPNEFNNLAEIIVDMYGLSHAIQVSLGKLHNTLNQRVLFTAPNDVVTFTAPNDVVTFTDVVCQYMVTFCRQPGDAGPRSKSFDEWMMTASPEKKNTLMCLKSAYVSRAENSCKVHDKPESEIVKKMELVMNISKTLELRGCKGEVISSMLDEMGTVFKKHFGSYVSTEKRGGGVSQEKCRLAITDYQSSFSDAMESLGCPIPRYDRLGEINRTRTSRLENASKNINLGFDVAVSDDTQVGENIADKMVKSGQALVCDAIKYKDFEHIPMIAHLNSSEIDAARLSLDIEKPLIILIESPVYDDAGGNTKTLITPIPCGFTSQPHPSQLIPAERELHEGDGGLFVFLSIPWVEPKYYTDTTDNWFQNITQEEKSKVIRPIICVYKITASFPTGEGYDKATKELCQEFQKSLEVEYKSLKNRSFKNCRVPVIRPIIKRLGIDYSFVFGITTTRGGVSNNLTLALILPHLAEGGGAKCFRGTCDVGSCIKLLENSGCSYLTRQHFKSQRASPASLTELNFLLGLNLKEYGDSTKAVCADIMRSSYKIPTILASVDWCLLLRQFEGVAAFRSDNVYKICGTTELKPLDPDEIRKIATLQALFMCYPDNSGLTTAEKLHQVLDGLQVDGAAAAAAGSSYDVFHGHIKNKIQQRVIRRITESLSKFRAGATLDVLPDYCEFVLFHSKLQTSNFLVERDKFIDMMSKPVTSHGHHICHDMLDFFDKYVIDTRKIDSFEYERMKLIEIKKDMIEVNKPGGKSKLLEQLISVPIHNPYVQKLLLTPERLRDNNTIIKQTESDLVGVFSNCSLFELLSLVAYYANHGGDVIFKTQEGSQGSTTRAKVSLPVERVKELLRPSLWSVFHEFFGAECGISDYRAHEDISKIKSVLLVAGFTYLSPDDIVRMKETKVSSAPPPKPKILNIGHPPQRPGAGQSYDSRMARENALTTLRKRQGFSLGQPSKKGGSRKYTKRTKKFKRTPNKRNKTIRNKINTKYSLRNTIKRYKTRRLNNHQ